MVEAIGTIVVGIILTGVQILLIKRIDDMSKKIDTASEWIAGAKEKHDGIKNHFDGIDHVMEDHENRINYLERFSDAVRIYHKQHHNQEL